MITKNEYLAYMKKFSQYKDSDKKKLEILRAFMVYRMEERKSVFMNLEEKISEFRLAVRHLSESEATSSQVNAAYKAYCIKTEPYWNSFNKELERSKAEFESQLNLI